jgi:hypothetical protein
MSIENSYQIHPELVGITGLNALLRESSAPRLYMFFGQLGQAVGVVGANANRFTTYAEDEFGKYTFGVRMRNRGEIYRVIRKFQVSNLDFKGTQSPSTVAIYQNLESDVREFDVIELETYNCMHQHFGFSFEAKPAMDRLHPRGVIRKGEELLGSPSVKSDGTYCSGTETNLALMTIPDGIEDGAKCSKEWLETQRTECFGRRVIRIGKGEVPLICYGFENGLSKIMPDVGERIGKDGLLFATRRIDPYMSCVQMLPRNLRADRLLSTDKAVYATPDAEVIDIKIIRGRGATNDIPDQLERQLLWYLEQQSDYYRQIHEVELDLYRNFGNRIIFSPALTRLFVDARAYLDMVARNRTADPIYNKVPVGEWMVVVEYRYWLTPGIGSKISDSQGAKAVVVSKAPRSEMPIDIHGNIADVVMDPNSTVKRSNMSRTTEQYLKASMLYWSNHIRAILDQKGVSTRKEDAWRFLCDYCRIISPRYADILESEEIDRDSELRLIQREGIRIWAPTDNPVEYYMVIAELEKRYKLPIGPVTYTGNSGKVRVTKQNILIGPVYMFLLEKDGRDWSAVASSRLHPSYGTPTKTGPADKYRSPGKESAVKVLGETEERLVYSACGGYTVQQIIERSNNPAAHRYTVRSIMKDQTPTNIENTVNWDHVPVNGGKPMQFVRHTYECMGIRWVIPEENKNVQYFPPGY